MKTLNVIQTLSKIGKILSKIINICCIVGFCGCIVGISAMLIGAETLKIGGVTLHSILQAESGISEGDVWAAIAVGIILSVGEYFVSRMSYRYFENELKAGTPFTYDGAKELLHLGISVVWIPLLSVILSRVAWEIISQFAENVETLSLDGFDSISLGVVLIIVSLLCKYGAELNGKAENVEPKGENSDEIQ